MGALLSCVSAGAGRGPGCVSPGPKSASAASLSCGALAASGCPQLVQGERRVSPVRLGGAGSAVCERVGAAVVRVAALEPAEPLPLFTCVCTTALLKREGGWHRVVWFSVLGVVSPGSGAGWCLCCRFPAGSRGRLDPPVFGAGVETPRGTGTREFPTLLWAGGSGPAGGSCSHPACRLLGRPGLLGLGRVLGSVLSSRSAGAWLCPGCPAGVTAVRGAEMGVCVCVWGDVGCSRWVWGLFGAPRCPCSRDWLGAAPSWSRGQRAGGLRGH